MDTSGFSAQNAIDDKPETFWAAGGTDTSAVLELSFDDPVTFNVIRLEEPIQYGQRIAGYRVMAYNEEAGAWVVISSGTTVGYRKLDRTFTVETTRIRLVIEEATAPPALSTFSLHLDKNIRERAWNRLSPN